MGFPPHFRLEEFTFSQTAIRCEIDNSPDDIQLTNLTRLAWWLETLREKIRLIHPDAYIIISSGLRVEALNLAIGGSKTSAHMKGLAADIHCNKLTPMELAVFIRDNMEDYDQVILEFNRWVHLGLSTVPREELLTAMKEDGRTVYKQGLI